MTGKTVTIENNLPRAASTEAQAFIKNAVSFEPASVAKEDIEGLREIFRTMYASSIEPILNETGVSHENVFIGGVECMVVTPKDYDAGNDERGILYFFGGGYVVGSPATDLIITAQLASLTGMKVYAPWYRLAPENPYPAAVDDGLAVYKELIEKMRSNGLSMGGESAGGNLALAVSLRAKELKIPQPASLVLLSPWSDLSGMSESISTHAGIDPTFPSTIDDGNMARAYGGGADLQDPLISPVYADYSGGFSPTLITTGTRDLLMSDCARLSTVMRLAGVDVRLNVWEGLWHVFEYYPAIPESRQSLQEIAAFLNAHTA